jgi:hypothetical protein
MPQTKQVQVRTLDDVIAVLEGYPLDAVRAETPNETAGTALVATMQLLLSVAHGLRAHAQRNAETIKALEARIAVLEGSTLPVTSATIAARDHQGRITGSVQRGQAPKLSAATK